MSWDVIICKFEGPPPDWDTVPLECLETDNPEPPPMPPGALALGTLDELHSKLAATWPTIVWSSPTHGIVEPGDLLIEVYAEFEVPLPHLALHVRGEGDPLVHIAAVCQANGWSAADMTTGKFLDLAAPSDTGWQQYKGMLQAVVGALENSRLMLNDKERLQLSRVKRVTWVVSLLAFWVFCRTVLNLHGWTVTTGGVVFGLVCVELADRLMIGRYSHSNIQ